MHENLNTSFIRNNNQSFVIKLKKGMYLFRLPSPVEIWCIQSDLNHMKKKGRDDFRMFTHMNLYQYF